MASDSDIAVADILNIRAACIAAKNEYPGSKWNDPEGDPVAALDRLEARVAYLHAGGDPDYACGAAFCDDPACNTHARGDDDD